MNKRNLEKAARKAVTKNRRNATWPVYGYEVAYDEFEWQDGSRSKLPRLVASEPKPAHIPLYKDGKPLLNEGERVHEFRMDFGVKRYYAPLQRPDLLFRLAEIGGLLGNPAKLERKGTHPLAEMIAFAGEFGLLGVSDPEGRRETLGEFSLAAATVNRTLRLLEAASAEGGYGDEEKLRRLYRQTAVHTLPDVDPDAVAKYRRKIKWTERDKLREQAWDEITPTVTDALDARAPTATYRLRTKEGRTVGLDSGDNFNSLLGAVYLQLRYLARHPNARRCAVCGGFIPPEKYSNARYCSDACKQKALRERKKKQAASSH